MKKLFYIFLLFFLCAGLAQGVRITEFLALNHDGQKDSFGDSSDWIEIYNDENTPINLLGFGLSDSESQPFKWTFPETNLVAGAFIVVRASDRNLKNPGEELHCGFKLSGDGEYLGLCDAEGQVLSEYAPQFPPQYDDLSYGVGCRVEIAKNILRDTNTPCRAFIPTDDRLHNTWLQNSFDDSTWLQGNSGVGYEKDPSSATSFSNYIGLDVSDMYGNNGSCFIRMPFTVPESRAYTKLVLRMIYDDGFVAYLNGTEVARKYAPDTLTWNSTATTFHNEYTVLDFEDFDISEYRDLLKPGENFLMLHALNDATTSSDFLMDAQLVGENAAHVEFGQIGYLSTMTPGALNGEAFEERLRPLTISASSGFYYGPLTLSLSAPDSNVVIRYTLDATEPTLTHGTLYTSPISIKETTVFRAGVFKSGAIGPRPVARTFIYLDDLISQKDGVVPGSQWPTGPVNGQVMDYGLDESITKSYAYSSSLKNAFKQVPILSLVVSPGNLFNASSGIYVNANRDGRLWERQADAIYLDEHGELFNVGCGLRIRGNFSRSSSNAKHSFRLFFRNEWGVGKLEYPLFGDEGVQSFDKVDLRTAQNFSWSAQGGNDPRENLMCRDVFARDLQREMGEPYTRSRYFHLLLNGHYWGLYQYQERSEDNFARDYFGGNKEDYDVIKTDNYKGSVNSGNIDAWRSLWELARFGFTESIYQQALGNNPDGTRNPSYPILLDPTNLADYTIVNNFIANCDAPLTLTDASPNNFFAIYNRVNPKGFKFFCHDSEHAMVKGYLNVDKTTSVNTGQSSPEYFNPRYLHQRLCAAEGYKKVFRSRVSKHYFSRGVCTPESAIKIFMQRVKEINLAIICESARWGDVRTDYESYQPFTKNNHWIPEITWVTGTFFRTRYNLTLSQFRTRGWYPNFSPPVISLPSGEVAPGARVTLRGEYAMLYTLDGSDPVSSPSSTRYTLPFTITRNSKLRVTYDPALCNPPLETEATYTVRRENPLLVTEIMYLPAPPDSSSSFTANDFSFLELFNNSAETYYPFSQALSGSVSFVFADYNAEIPPFSYALLVANKAAFANRYETNDLSIIGELTGNFPADVGSVFLPNYGFTFSGFWFPGARSLGPSIVSKDYSQPLDSYSSKTAWRLSYEDFGSPGREDLPEPTFSFFILLFNILIFTKR